jgi:hypothetical protein
VGWNLAAMKSGLLLAALSLVFAGCVFAQAPAASDIQLTKISRTLLPTPEFNTSGGGPTFRTNSRDRWLAIDVDFTAAPEWTDEVTFKYYLLLNGKLLTGEVSHTQILAGKELHSVMYVSPHAIAHLMGNRPLTTASVENIAVQAILQGVVKDELSLNRARPQWYATLQPLPGFLLNKNETPFAPLYWDHYEQIKPVGTR